MDHFAPDLLSSSTTYMWVPRLGSSSTSLCPFTPLPARSRRRPSHCRDAFLCCPSSLRSSHVRATESDEDEAVVSEIDLSIPRARPKKPGNPCAIPTGPTPPCTTPPLRGPCGVCCAKPRPCTLRRPCRHCWSRVMMSHAGLTLPTLQCRGSVTVFDSPTYSFGLLDFRHIED
jgi:hypothetical protein